MKYKDLLIGDWFKYNGCYYIKSQKYTGFDFINVSLCDGHTIKINDNAEVEFASCFFTIKRIDYMGALTSAPLGIMVQNNKCIYMRVTLPDANEIDTVIIYSFYNNNGRWFSSRAYHYEVETFTRKIEYWES